MRTLTPLQIVSVGCANETHATRAQSRILPMMSAAARETGAFVRNWKEGLMACNNITVNDQPAYAVFWTRGFDNALTVHGAASLRDGTDFADALMTGLEILAREMGCTQIIFHSNRFGMGRKAMDFGFQPLSVCYRKELA